MKGTIQKWKLVILLDALLFLSNMTFAKDTINQYTEGNPIDTTAVSISDKTNIPDRLYVDSLSLKRHFIHRIGIEARPGYIFPTSSMQSAKLPANIKTFTGSQTAPRTCFAGQNSGRAKYSGYRGRIIV